MCIWYFEGRNFIDGNTIVPGEINYFIKLDRYLIKFLFQFNEFNYFTSQQQFHFPLLFPFLLPSPLNPSLSIHSFVSLQKEAGSPFVSTKLNILSWTKTNYLPCIKVGQGNPDENVFAFFFKRKNKHSYLST